MRHSNSGMGVLVSSLLLSVLAACGGGGGGDAAPTPTPAPAPTPAPPTITAQPQDQSALTGATATFRVTASGEGLSYQWRRNSTAIAGATSASYTTPALGHTDHGAQYTVVVTGAGGSATSSAARVTLSLSNDQALFEGLMLNRNEASYRLRWNLAYAGPQTSGTNFAYSESVRLSASPLTAGPQLATTTAPANLTTTLPLSSALLPRPTRVLKNGTVLVVPGAQETRRFSYVGSQIRAENLAADNTTVAYSTLLSGYTLYSIIGNLAGAPPELARTFDAFFANPAVFTAGATFLPDTVYTRFTATNEGDRYDVVDCGSLTTDANVTPCYANTTLQAALTTGLASPADGRTYHLADGTVSTVGGVPVWVATAPRPLSATLSSTVQYRIYFQRNGHVYTGVLVRDGAVLGGTYYVSNPGGATPVDRLTFLNYQIRLNKAAHDSFVAAIGL